MITTTPRSPWEYHTISCEGPLPDDQLNELSRRGWELFSVCGPVGATDRRRDHHFRRPLDPPLRMVTR